VPGSDLHQFGEVGMMWTYRERRNRAAFSNAQLAYDRAVDPLWDQPDPEPEHEDDEQEADDGLGE
ncbi:MAG: hypothetical protein E6801_31700, partial [Pseudomonas aeruginosa]|nr:hypothetical protein [Pseudomonas aeruginosa]